MGYYKNSPWARRDKPFKGEEEGEEGDISL